MPVHFYEVSVKSKLKNKIKLKSFIERMIRKEGCMPGTISYIFCDDDYLLELNEQYLKHVTYTDVITFMLSSPNNPIVGEVYISVERVKENAGKFKVSYLGELHRIIFHGTLHLCGYNDKQDRQKAIMSAKEDKYLAEYYTVVSRET